MASYKARLTSPPPRLRDFWRILKEGGFKGRNHPERDAAKVPLAQHPTPLPATPTGGFCLTWIGHATYLVRVGGLAILTDPNLSPKLPGRIKRLVPPGLAFDDLPPIDAVVIGHNHYDHLDAPTIKRLPRETAVFVPLGVKRWFTKRGFTNVTQLDWWQSAVHKGAMFTLTPVHHWSGRIGFDNHKTLWGGWAIEAAGRKLFFASDTAYGARFAEVGQRLGPFDAAMMPIGAYAPRWFMKGVHMDPDEALQALGDLRATRMATMHWGTFALTQEPLLEPLERVRAAWEKSGRSRENLWDLAIGETRVAG